MRGGLRTSAQTAITCAVHDHPGVTRAEVAAQIGIPSGFAAETVARLVASGSSASGPPWPRAGAGADDVLARPPRRPARGRRRHHP